MTLHRLRFLSWVVLPFVLFLSGCQKSIHQSSERYVFVANNITLPYWQEARAGFLESADVLGVKADFVGPANYSPADQLRAFQDAVSSKPTGILVSPTRAALFQSAIDRAVELGIPVVCVDSDSPESKRVLFVGTENYRAGIELGTLIMRSMREQGMVVVITVPGQPNLEERLRGVRQVLSAYPRVQITNIIDDQGDPAKAAAQLTELLSAKKQVDAVICLEASGGPGAAQALKQFGVSGKIPMVAMDKNPETLDLVKTGVIVATVAQKPYTMSFYGLKFLDDLNHNIVKEFKDWRTAPTSPLPKFVDTGIAVINEHNVEDFATALVVQRRRY
jgi:ribose transport system substrate-binding protein